MKLDYPKCENNILLYLKFLAQSKLRSTTIRNHLSALNYYFDLFKWPKNGLCSKKLLIKSVKINAPLGHKVKGVFTLSMLKDLVRFCK